MRFAPAIIAAVLGVVPSVVFAAHPQAVPTRPEHARISDVTVWRDGFASRHSFPTFEAAYKNGGDLAAGDVDGDGRDEIIVGAGPGRPPDVRIYSTDGKLLHSFRAYASWFKGGVRVAAADTDGNGTAEIVTAPGPGIEPLLHVFSATGTHLVPGGILAYRKEFVGGVHVAAGDIDGDGRADIVTTPGPGGGPHVRLWNGKLEHLGRDFFAFDQGMRDGVSLALLRSPTGPVLAAAPESWTSSTVRLYGLAGTTTFIREFQAFDPSSRHGVRLAAFDLDHDGRDEIAVSRNGGAAPEVRVHDQEGTERGKWLLLDPAFRGSLAVAQVDTEGDGKTALATMSAFPVVQGPLDTEKFIDVNLKEQRLYAYERGRVARTFLVSTGTLKYPTPIVETSVLEKIPMKDYKWTYGKNHPDNYYLKNVKNNLRVYGAVYIHYAYWHRNFGHRMSHGCINVGNADSEWIYGWADVGTPVKTHF